jgi:von Willebrand factor type A domain
MPESRASLHPSLRLRVAAGLSALAAIAGCLAWAPPGAAETCWTYVDNPASVPLRCVQKNDLTTPCSWPTDCTAVPAAPGSETILEMHRIWHDCFGAVGGSTPPPGRGQRWYAFHRQFEYDYDAWRRANSPFGPIESLDWCPGMDLPHGIFPSGPPAHSAGLPAFSCSTKPDRPDHVPCPDCIAFAQCLFLPGGGPIGCPAAPSPTCSTPDSSVSFPFASLDQFTNVDDVAKILDGEFHGRMHGAVATADKPGFYNDDNGGSDCSPRDGMFWRLHKALDDVVRAWQDVKAVDVVIVLDRSGSMGDPDASGGTKLQAALAAVNNFAGLLEVGRTDGQSNHIGLVSFSTSATTDLVMTTADSTLLAPGGQLAMSLANIASAGPGGCTGMGEGIQKALALLCPPGGDCSGASQPGNPRKAILLLTDGIENVPPCLQPAGPSGGTCGSQCFGAQIDYSKLAFTQLVAVGFGTAASLDGAKLTVLAERQGGIYVQNPGGANDDLKHFFTKGFGQLTDEFTRVDPTGLLAEGDAATDPVEYSSCGDSKLTFASGWLEAVTPGALRLQVTSPTGALIVPGGPGVQAGREPTWDFARVRLPQGAPVAGHWSAQIVRPHRVYVNGFTPDAFIDAAAGTALVRREIHRLCPSGCKKVLAFEFGRQGPVSVYARALAEERAAGLLSAVHATTAPAELAKALAGGRWDLIVYAYMGPEKAQPYDQALSNLVCETQRAILTDVRAQVGGPVILRCGGALRDGSTNWPAFAGDGKLVRGPLALGNPGYPVWSYGLRPTSAQSLVQAATLDGKDPAVTAIVTAGKDARWYLDVLGAGLARIDLHDRSLDQRAGDTLYATARILPSFVPAGGFDKVDARVEVEYPKIGLGTLLARAKSEPRRVNGELLDARMAAAEKLAIPTATATFRLYDDGTHGDEVPNNAYWTAALTGLGATDGPYTLHFLFDLTKNGCTTHRELTSSIYVDVRPDPRASGVRVVSQAPVSKAKAGGAWRTVLQLTPADRFGNLWGPGRFDAHGCDPADACRIDPQSVVDSGTGTYTFAIDTKASAAGVRLLVAGGSFDLALPCPDCPRLTGLQIQAARSFEHSSTRATVHLDKPAPAGGALVFLASANPLAATVPASVRVPAGASQAVFDVTLHHAHDGPAAANLTATYGGAEAQAAVTVLPIAWKSSSTAKPAAAQPHHDHSPQPPAKPPGR